MSNAVVDSLVSLTPVEELSLAPEEEQRYQELAKKLAEENPLMGKDQEQYKTLLPSEIPTGPVWKLLFDDFSAIAHLQHVLGLDYYTARAFARASTDDIVLGTFGEVPGYIDYIEQYLGLGRPIYTEIKASKEHLPYGICDGYLALEENQDKLIQQLIQTSKSEEQTLWIHPFLGHKSVWQMAQHIEKAIPNPVKVLAPPPTITTETNNKVWFLQVVREVLGEEATVPTLHGTHSEQVTDKLIKMLQDHPTVALKLADSASGMGTGIFERDILKKRSPEELHEDIKEWLKQKDWDLHTSLPISVEAWKDDVLASPSTQLWLPPVDKGLPLVEGVFDQQFYPSKERVFLGSVSSTLPERFQTELKESSLRLARVFQHLGYIGRCSFDTILTGPSIEEAKIRFVECNGRWGGTSTPMSLINRLFGDFRKVSYQASDFDSPAFKGMLFSEFAELFKDILYNHKTKEGWAILYNVGCLEPTGKLDVITLGKDHAEATARQKLFRELAKEKEKTL